MHAVFDALARHAVERPQATAMAGDGVRLSWAELAAAVGRYVHALEGAPDCVAIGLPGGVGYAVADLALTLTGRRQVPLPFFFSAEQIGHVLDEARPGAVICEGTETFAGLPAIAPPRLDADAAQVLPPLHEGAERVIHTSGSSGRPKGVVIGAAQMSASLAALAPLIQAGPSDRHLSVLPLPQLLEQICGIYLPVLAGAEVHFDFAATQALFGGDAGALLAATERVRPTTCVVVPGLLSRWVAALEAAGARAPDSLRFVAVGGAASAPALLRAAWARGIPAHEGYGLSECCAVVAMNRPRANVIGTAGEVLDGIDLRIEEGEITVAGPTVMSRYLGGPPAPERWRTGDLGRLENGRLIVEGRKDTLLVTPEGRNISPEWVEQRVDADPRVLASALGLRRDGALVLVVVACAPVEPAEIALRLSDLPAYARPVEAILTGPDEPGLLRPAGTPDRAVAARIIAERRGTPLQPARETVSS